MQSFKRYVLLAVSLVPLTAGAAFWMGRLSASSPAVRSEQGYGSIGTTLEDRHPTLQVAGLSVVASTGAEEKIPPASPTPQPAAAGPAGTIKSADKSEAATAGIAKPSTRTAAALAVVKRERAANVSRMGHPVGPDGIGFEPVRRGDQ
jgi:hypothetical protein